MSVAPLPIVYDLGYLADGTPYCCVPLQGGGGVDSCPDGYILIDGVCKSLDAPAPIQDQTGGIKCPVGTMPNSSNTQCITATPMNPLPNPVVPTPVISPNVSKVASVTTTTPNYLLYIAIGLGAFLLLKD